MSRPTIVYLHGFRSSPASIKARELAQAVAAVPDAQRPRLSIPALPDRPAQAMASILTLADGIPKEALTFVGSSLGGYYATYAAEKTGARAVLINPAVRAAENLAPYKGPQTNLHTGATFEITERHFDEFRAFAAGAITQPCRYLLFVQSGDEVLAYREAVAFYAGAWQCVEGGGDHAFQGFARHIPTILRFSGVTREAGFVRCG